MDQNFIIYHNPRCKRSREALDLLRNNGIEPEVVQYLKTTPEKADLKKILAKLDVPVDAIIRKEEKIYKERFKGKNFTDDEWLTILHENPKLIQRPIVLRSNRGVIGRPTENVNELLK